MNGAVVGEFKAPNKFKYYDKGVLMDEQRPGGDSSFIQTDTSKQTSEQPPEGTELQVSVEIDSSLQIANQNLDHSIVILGWGKDPKSGADVWIARNSFGPNWGEKGDFYIRRGQNDFGIESEISSYNIELL
jgi:C1A family cysteine protease